MRKVGVMAAKDLLRSIRDRSAIILGLVAPLALSFVLGAVLGEADEDSFDANYAFVDLDNGQISEAFAGVMADVESGSITVRELESAERARELVRDGEVAAAFVLPESLSEDTTAGEAATIEVLGDPDSPIAVDIAEAIARGFASEVQSQRVAIATVAAARAGPGEVTLFSGQAALEELAQQAAETESPILVDDDPLGAKTFEDKTFFAAGMTVFFLFFTSQFGAVSLLRERREGTLARLLAAPVSRGQVVASKALFSFMVSALSMTVMIVATTFLMDATWGNPAGIAVLIACGVFAAIGVQSLVTTLARTDEQAAGYGAIIGVTLGMVGGTFFPLSQGPALLTKLSLLTPHAWLMRGFGELSGGQSVSAVALPALALIAFGLVTGTIALMRANKLVGTR